MNIRESVSLLSPGGKGKSQVEVQLEEMDETEKKLFDIGEKIGV